MKKIFLVLLVLCCFFVVFAATDSNQSIVDKFSYVVGASIFADYADYYGINAKNFAQGALDVEKGTYSISDEEMSQIVQSFSSYLQSKMASDNLAYAEAFLVENKKNKDVITTKTGLQYKINQLGSGKKATSSSTVSVYYTLTLPDGTIADQCVSPSNPSTFKLSNLVAGFREVCTLVPVGSKVTAWLHPDLGYGANGAGSNIEPNMLLQFDIEIVSIN